MRNNNHNVGATSLKHDEFCTRGDYMLLESMDMEATWSSSNLHKKDRKYFGIGHSFERLWPIETIDRQHWPFGSVFGQSGRSGRLTNRPE
jgi:hypothetical protein